MTKCPVIAFAQYERSRTAPGRGAALQAEAALNLCEDAYLRKDWRAFDHWFHAFRKMAPSAVDWGLEADRHWFPLGGGRDTASAPAQGVGTSLDRKDK